ncbi:glutamate receptor ionotropic, kainate glr-3-like [Penaeus vannamei]|uniref:glutamate receptor ionotropic, kainate glr-3-like n=1 Tax=Penaeus vannamei TaxID=6689 RepID=UPI00387F9337
MARYDMVGGKRFPNGSWNGLMGLVHRNELNMSGLGLVMSHDRFLAVDISEYLYLDESSAAYVRPVVGSHVDGFLRPYTFRMWMVILAMVFVTMMSISLIRLGYNYLIRSFKMNDSPSDTEDFQHQELLRVTKDSAMWTVYTLLAQSTPKALRGDSIRLVSCLWLFGCLILASVYRSNLKAMLILPRVSVAFNSLEELVETGLPVWTATSSVLHNAAAVSRASARICTDVRHAARRMSKCDYW